VRHRAPRTHLTNHFFFRSREKPAGRTDRPIEASASEPTKPTHARISIKPLRPAWAVRGSFRRHGSSSTSSALLVSPAPALLLATAQPLLTLVRLRIRGSRREVSARARLRSDRWRSKPYTLDGSRFVHVHGGMVSPNSPSASLFSLLLQVVAGRLR
jgi:hypothetical protein